MPVSFLCHSFRKTFRDILFHTTRVTIDSCDDPLSCSTTKTWLEPCSTYPQTHISPSHSCRRYLGSGHNGFSPNPLAHFPASFLVNFHLPITPSTLDLFQEANRSINSPVHKAPKVPHDFQHNVNTLQDGTQGIPSSGPRLPLPVQIPPPTSTPAHWRAVNARALWTYVGATLVGNTP